MYLRTHAIHVLIQPFPLDNTGRSWWDYCLLLLPLLPVAECSQRLLTSQMLRSWSILIFRIISGYFSRYLSICLVWCLLSLRCDIHTHTHTHTQWVSICNKMSYYIYDVRKDNSLQSLSYINVKICHLSTKYSNLWINYYIIDFQI